VCVFVSGCVFQFLNFFSHFSSCKLLGVYAICS
jgi:hypothetical protein